MNNKILSGLIFLASLLMLTSPVLGATLDVCGSGCNSTTIQGAIDMASSGDTIEVSAETYNEIINVTESVTLLGANHDNDPAGSTDRGGESIISGGRLTIKADNVTVNGFKMTVGGIYTDFPSALNVNIIYNILVDIEDDRGIRLWFLSASHLADGGYIGYNTISGIPYNDKVS